MFAVGGIENFPSGEIIDELVCRWFCNYSHLVKDRGAETQRRKFIVKTEAS